MILNYYAIQMNLYAVNLTCATNTTYLIGFSLCYFRSAAWSRRYSWKSLFLQRTWIFQALSISQFFYRKIETPCSNTECWNGGSCIITSAIGNCQCLAGFVGVKCEGISSFIVSDPSCQYGAAHEKLRNVLLDCPVYLHARTIDNLNMVTTCYTLNIKFLTCGNVNLTYEQICIILKYVFDYIKNSKRFLIVLLELNWVNMHIIWIHLNFIFPSVFEYSSLIRY